MEEVKKTFIFLGNFILLIILTVLFVPSFLIVTYLQPIWAKKLSEIGKL